MKTKLRQAIKRHGGKGYLADWIISHFPPRVKNPNKPADDDPGWVHYVEPYYGGGSVQQALDPEGISEVVNDRDRDLINFFSVVRSEKMFPMFQREVEGIPCGKDAFYDAVAMLKLGGDLVKRAAAFFVVNRQSRQALGKDFATLARVRTRSGMNELPSAWLSAIDGLPELHARMRRVVILNDPAVKVIKQQDGPRTLFYCDPPYMHETRTATAAYHHEMTKEDHHELLQTLAVIQGRFVLSGYPSELYDIHAKHCGWRRVEIEIDNKASSKKSKDKKTECLWMNY